MADYEPRKIKLKLKTVIPIKPDGKIYLISSSIYNPYADDEKLRDCWFKLTDFWNRARERNELPIIGLDQSRKYKARDVIKGWPFPKSTTKALEDLDIRIFKGQLNAVKIELNYPIIEAFPLNDWIFKGGKI
jgi:hypothetical protein